VVDRRRLDGDAQRGRALGAVVDDDGAGSVQPHAESANDGTPGRGELDACEERGVQVGTHRGVVTPRKRDAEGDRRRESEAPRDAV